MTTARTRTRHPARRRRRAGALSRWRVSARLARRQAARTRLSSLLVVILVALPIAGMTGFAVWAMSSVSTPEERARVELGRMQAWVAPAGVPDAGFWQAPTEPEWHGYPVGADGVSEALEGVPLEDPAAALPPGTEVVEIVERGTVRVRTAAGEAPVTAWAGETWHEEFAGKYDLVDGRRPSSASEAMVTPAALERLGIGIGGELALPAEDLTFTVVGTLDAAGVPDADAGVFLPLTDRTRQFVSGEHRWYLAEPALPWSDVEELNEQGVVALSREVLLDPPTRVNEDAQRAQANQTAVFWSMVAVIAIGGAFAAYVVVMLAGAAFAVAARRQQRALAIVASVGGSRRDLFRTVALQGTVLGAVGGVVGTALGVGLAAGGLAIVDDGSGISPWGFHVPWLGVAGIFVFSVLVGTLSAFVPARTVARTDAISALRGARRPQRPTASRPVWGSVLLLVGVGITLACGVGLAVLNRNGTGVRWDSPLSMIPVYGIVAGPILAQVGILLSGRWLLWTVSRGLSRASTAARIASRDAAANASRTVPAFAAIGATVFLGVFVAAVSAMGTANSARNHVYTAPVGSVVVSMGPPATTSGAEPLSAESARRAIESARTMVADAGADGTATIARQLPVWNYAHADDVPDDMVRALAVLPERHLLDPESVSEWRGAGDPQNNISVISSDELSTALGVSLSPGERAAYDRGAVVVTDPRYVVDGTVQFGGWSGRDLYEGRAPDNVWRPSTEGPERSDPMWEESADAIVEEGAHGSIVVAMAPQTAQELGIQAQPEVVIASFDDPISVESRDRLNTQANLAGTRDYSLWAYVETGPPSDLTWLIPLATTVSVLVVGASAVALGLARFERRPDDATLAAVGGTPALRRRIGFWQGLLIAGFGTISGAVAGILPAIGLSIQSQGTQRLTDVPWLGLAALAIALPLVIALANALVPPRRPDLTRRTVIA